MSEEVIEPVHAVLATLRSELRGRYRRWLGSAALLGLASGLVLGAMMGARRTDSAYQRLLKESNAFDYVLADVGDPTTAQLDLSKVAALPEVADTSEYRLYSSPFRAGRESSASDPRFGVSVDRFHVVTGRMYDPAAADEAVVSTFTAETRGLHVGRVVELPFGEKKPDDTILRLKIVGTVVAPGLFPPRPAGLGDPIFLSPGFARAHPERFSIRAVMFRLKRGAADVDRFKADLDGMAGGKPISFQIEQRLQDRATERAIHVQAVAL